MMPMLCKSDLKAFVDHAGGFANCLVSLKKDGIRCLATRWASNGKWTYESRNGNALLNFGVFDRELETVARRIGINGDLTLDGEVVDASGKFDRVLTQVHRQKEVDASRLRFWVFDVPSNKPLIDRYGLLQRAFDGHKGTRTALLDHSTPSFETVEACINEVNRVTSMGEEGIVLKTSRSIYAHGKSLEWCKVKKLSTLDLRVIGSYDGNGRLSGMIGGLIAVYKGHEVRIGTGFTDSERREFSARLPRIVEAQYQEITKDGMLRFPSFVRVRAE